MARFPFVFLGHGLGDRLTCKIYVYFHERVGPDHQRKLKDLLVAHEGLFQLSDNWGTHSVILLPGVPRISIWLTQIATLALPYPPPPGMRVRLPANWDPRVDFRNASLYESFNFDWEDMKPHDRQRLLLNFSFECFLSDLHKLIPIRFAFLYQGMISMLSSWGIWSETRLPEIVEDIANGVIVFPKEHHGQHHFLGDLFSAVMSTSFLARLPGGTREKLFELFFEACDRRPDRFDMKWLLRLNGGDEVGIMSRLSREEIRSIIKDYLVMKGFIKGGYRGAAYEPGDTAMRWLQDAFEADFRELMKTT